MNSKRMLVGAMALALTAAAVIGGVAANELRELSTASLANRMLRLGPDRPGAFLNAAIAGLEPDSRHVRLRIRFPPPGFLDADRVLLTAYPSGTKSSAAFPMGMQDFYFRGLPASTVQPPDKPPPDWGELLTKEFDLPTGGETFAYPFDTYTVTFTITWWTTGGKAFDFNNVPWTKGNIGGFAGLWVTNDIPGMEVESSAFISSDAIFRVTLSRPLFPKVLFFVFFGLTLAGALVAIHVTEGARLIAASAGAIGALWAIRNIVYLGNSFRSATLVDVLTYFQVLVLLGAALAKWAGYWPRLGRHSPTSG